MVSSLLYQKVAQKLPFLKRFQLEYENKRMEKEYTSIQELTQKENIQVISIYFLLLTLLANFLLYYLAALSSWNSRSLLL